MAAPLAGAALGLAAAVTLCWLLYRQAVRLNIGVFFSRTAIALIVIAAGVLAHGLGDLQEAGLLPGQRWTAFDLTAHVDPNSWWLSVITGATELSPAMTVLQVVAWVVYLAMVIPLFVRTGRPAVAVSRAAVASPAAPGPASAAAAPAQVKLTGRRWTGVGRVGAAGRAPAVGRGRRAGTGPGSRCGSDDRGAAVRERSSHHSGDGDP